MTTHETSEETAFGPTEPDAAIQRTFEASSERVREARTDSAREILNAVIGVTITDIRNTREGPT